MIGNSNQHVDDFVLSKDNIILFSLCFRHFRNFQIQEILDQ